MVANAPQYGAALFDTPVFPGRTSIKIKLLDLLTNRYHLGIIRSRGDESMSVELPSCSRLRAGQRVRFVIAEEQALVSRTKMRTGCITQVITGMNHIHIELTPFEEAVAA